MPLLHKISHWFWNDFDDCFILINWIEVSDAKATSTKMCIRNFRLLHWLVICNFWKLKETIFLQYFFCKTNCSWFGNEQSPLPKVFTSRYSFLKLFMAKLFPNLSEFICIFRLWILTAFHCDHRRCLSNLLAP